MGVHPFRLCLDTFRFRFLLRCRFVALVFRFGRFGLIITTLLTLATTLLAFAFRFLRFGFTFRLLRFGLFG